MDGYRYHAYFVATQIGTGVGQWFKVPQFAQPHAQRRDKPAVKRPHVRVAGKDLDGGIINRNRAEPGVPQESSHVLSGGEADRRRHGQVGG